MEKTCLILQPGMIDYAKALKLQEGILNLKKEEVIQEDIVIFLQHPPTITIGKQGSLSEVLADKEKLREKGVLVYKIGRGGKITFHGPGQLVGYPILDLRDYGKDLHLYLRYLEEVIIRTLQDFGVQAGRKRGLTGVWVGERKIASIGVQAKSWISMHGFALNINCELNYFNLIQPCGMGSQVMTSLAKVLKKDIDTDTVAKKLVSHFAQIFSVNIKPVSVNEIAELQPKMSFKAGLNIYP